jgi:hypothetical protein
VTPEWSTQPDLGYRPKNLYQESEKTKAKSLTNDTQLFKLILEPSIYGHDLVYLTVI